MKTMWVRLAIFFFTAGVLFAGCQPSAVEPVRREASPAWRRASILWRVQHRSLLVAIGRDPGPRDRSRLHEAHHALLEQLVHLKHLDVFGRSPAWDRILVAYRDLFARALGGVSPRVLELRYYALGREVETLIERETSS